MSDSSPRQGERSRFTVTQTQADTDEEPSVSAQRVGNDFEIRALLISLLRNTAPRVALKIAAVRKLARRGRSPAQNGVSRLCGRCRRPRDRWRLSPRASGAQRGKVRRRRHRPTVDCHQFCVHLGDSDGWNQKEQTKEQRGEAISQLREKVPAWPTFSINSSENSPFLALTLAQSAVPARFSRRPQGSHPCIL